MLDRIVQPADTMPSNSDNRAMGAAAPGDLAYFELFSAGVELRVTRFAPVPASLELFDAEIEIRSVALYRCPSMPTAIAAVMVDSLDGLFVWHAPLLHEGGMVQAWRRQLDFALLPCVVMDGSSGLAIRRWDFGVPLQFLQMAYQALYLSGLPDSLESWVRYRQLVPGADIGMLAFSRGTVWKRAGAEWTLARVQPSQPRPDHLRSVGAPRLEGPQR